MLEELEFYSWIDLDTESDTPPEGEDLGLEFSVVQREDIGGDDGPRATPNPAKHSGTSNAEVMEEARIAFLADEVSHSVVVGTEPDSGWHGTWWSRPAPQADTVQGESCAIPHVLHLHAKKSGMLSFAPALGHRTHPRLDESVSPHPCSLGDPRGYLLRHAPLRMWDCCLACFRPTGIGCK